MTPVLAFEVVAVVLAALSAMITAAKKDLDFVGTYSLAVVVAFGGGTIRDVLLMRRPFFWAERWEYLVVIFVLCVPFVYSRAVHRLAQRVVARGEFVDALGLGFYTGESRPQIERAVREAVESGTPYDLELQIVSAKGVPKWIRTQGVPVLKDGRVVQVRGTFQDITERRKASEALRASERFTEATLDALAAHICVLDERGRIIKVNRAWREFAAANGLSLPEAGLGADYLAVCEAALGSDAPAAEVVAEAIRRIAEGGREHYGAEYPCHSPEEAICTASTRSGGRPGSIRERQRIRARRARSLKCS